MLHIPLENTANFSLSVWPGPITYLHSTNIQSLWKDSFCEQGKNGNDHLDPLMELYRGLPKNTPKTYIHCWPYTKIINSY